MTLVVLALYIAALATPACYFEPEGRAQLREAGVYTNSGGPSLHGKDFKGALGIDALDLGWQDDGPIPELANIALVLGLLAFLANRSRFAIGLGAVGVVLALTAPSIYKVKVELLGIGFYLWILSMVALVIGSALSVRQEDEERRSTSPQPISA